MDTSRGQPRKKRRTKNTNLGKFLLPFDKKCLFFQGSCSESGTQTGAACERFCAESRTSIDSFDSFHIFNGRFSARVRKLFLKHSLFELEIFFKGNCSTGRFVQSATILAHSSASETQRRRQVGIRSDIEDVGSRESVGCSCERSGCEVRRRREHVFVGGRWSANHERNGRDEYREKQPEESSNGLREETLVGVGSVLVSVARLDSTKSEALLREVNYLSLESSILRIRASFRLNPTGGTKVGTGIGDQNGVVSVTQVLQDSAGQKVGIRINDRVLAIDGELVSNRDTCKTLVQNSMGNPFDMILERAPILPPAPPPAQVNFKLSISTCDFLWFLKARSTAASSCRSKRRRSVDGRTANSRRRLNFSLRNSNEKGPP